MPIRKEKVYQKGKRWWYNFECECGTTFIARGDGNPKSCGCLNNSYKNRELPEGSKWKLLEPALSQKAKIKAKCTLCDEVYSLTTGNFFSGKSLNCVKCGAAETRSAFSKSVGGVRNHKLYGVWDSIVQRCTNPKSSAYKYYGGCGVTVCDEWKSSAETFIKWALENGWKDGLQVDKDMLSEKLGISPHRYSPETCCFLSHQENSLYKRVQSNNTSGAVGVAWSKTMKKFRAYIDRDGKRTEVGYFTTVEEAALERNKILKESNG